MREVGDGRGACVVLVMGVAGAGKTVVGRGVAERVGSVFVDADDLHPVGNVEKMRRGEALGDAERWPWLRAVRGEVERLVVEGRGVVVACSALKRGYREVLLGGVGGGRGVGGVGGRGVRRVVVFLRVEEDVARERVGGRGGHFMPAGLVGDQFAVLEEPGVAEAWELGVGLVVVDGSLGLEEVGARVWGEVLRGQGE